jgi:uncharacterized repeat protein (TIGR01451 family)
MIATSGSSKAAVRVVVGLALFVFAAATLSRAAVGIDSVTNGTLSYVGGTSGPLSFSHISAANTYLVVAVSLSQASDGNARVGSVTYNSIALTSLGATSGNSRRVEFWGISVSAATTANVVVTLINVNNGRRVGIVAGAISFTGTDPTSPVGTPAFATGNSNAPSVTISSSANQLILDAVATTGTVATVAPGSGQTQYWTGSTGTNTGDTRGAGGTEAGAATVTMSESLSSSSAWEIGALPIYGAATGNLCATPGNDGVGNVTGIVNSYYAPSGTVTLGPGDTSIALNAGVGANADLNAGDLLMIMQMQDADINSSNDQRYGSGVGTAGVTTGAGSGYTNLNSAGLYEYVVAANSVTFASGGTLSFTGAGAGGGVVNTYTQAAATTTKGQSRFQIIRVPQYSSATLGNGGNVAVATAWNGTVGGVFAIDVAGALTLNGTVNVDALGFRGGGGRTLAGGTGNTTDYRTLATVNLNASKGEGIAGTPRYVISSAGALVNTGVEGLPSGSNARGAPGNAGGGGTDGDPAGNSENTGGGGGGNGGVGGTGGNSWNTNLAIGGFGGVGYPANVGQFVMGGGGGAGTTNNGTSDPNTNTTGINSSGATGGGIVVIRASEVAGTGTISANGGNSLNTQNDSTGGGGAGGTVVVLAQHSGLTGLTASAHGGDGGTAWGTQGPGSPCPGGGACNYHGPGGGGGGGVVILSSPAFSTNVAGGLNGTTTTAGVAYGATPGSSGVVITNASLAGMGGASSGAACVPDLAISGTGLSPLVRGTNWSYALTVSNLGIQSTSGLVEISDVLPFGLSVTSASGTGWSCNLSGQAVSCTRSDALSGFSNSYPVVTLNGSTTQTAPDAPTNIATTNGGGETYLGNDSTTTNLDVTSTADLALTSSASPSLVVAGGSLTFTQQVSNSGPSDATQVFFTTAIPGNTTFQSISAPAGWSCSTPAVGGTGNITCVATSLAAGGTATFVIGTTVNGGVASGTVITNSANVSALTSDPFYGNNSTSTAVTVGTTGQSDLAITNSASPSVAAVGAQVTFTHVVNYTGPSAASNVSFAETLPANTSAVTAPTAAGWTCSSTPPYSCTISSLASGSATTFTTVVQITGGTSVTDTGSVTSSPVDTFSGNNSASATVTVSASGADLAVTDIASPVQVLAGNSVVFSHTVTNNGPNASGTVTLTDTLPTGTTFQSATWPPGWSCSNVTNVVTCFTSSLAINAAATINVTAQVGTTVTNGTVLTDSVSVPNSASDPVSANNTASASTTVSAGTNLAVAMTGNPDPVSTGGGPLVITSAVTNAGPSNSGSTTFTITVPANATYSSITPPANASWSCTGPTSGVITCNVSDLPVGYSGNFSLNLTVGTLPANTNISSTATVMPNSISEKIPADNTATYTTVVASATQTDLALTLAASPTPATAGSNLTYTGTATNKGPASAAAPVLTFTIPAGTTYVSSSVPGSTCNSIPVGGTGTLACTATGAFPSGTSANFQVVVKVNSSDTASISASATITSTTLGPNGSPAAAVASVTTPVVTSADLSVSNSCTPDQVAGSNIVCSQMITNLGPSDAQGVVLTEAVPANTTYVSATGATCNQSAGTVTCSVGTVAVGVPVTITFTTKINAGTPRGTRISDTANVTTTTSDPVSTNNTASSSTTVAIGTDADVSVTNVSSASTVLAGNNVTFTQAIVNNGPASAGTVTLTETIPTNATFVSWSGAAWTCSGVPAAGGSGTFTCTATLAANASAPFTLVVKASSGASAGTVLTDTASAASATADPNSSNNSASASSTVVSANQADVSVTMTPASTTVQSGSAATFNLAVANGGPASAMNTVVTIPLPAQEQFVSATPSQGSCSANGSTVTCLLGTIASGGSATIALVVNAVDLGSGSNSATVSSDQADPVTSNNTATAAVLFTSPTEVKLDSFEAAWSDGSLTLEWRTKEEIRNLGFNIYRDVNGQRVKLNPSLIAGAALRMRAGLVQHTASAYSWTDATPSAGTSYWLEDISLSGARTLHGPVQASGVAIHANSRLVRSALVSELNTASSPTAPVKLTPIPQAADTQISPQGAGDISRGSRGSRNPSVVSSAALAGQKAVKIAIQHEGWYRITAAQLSAAGLDANTNPDSLRLISEGSEIPMAVSRANNTLAAIEFYGIGLDTPFTDTRLYWLIWGAQPGQRVTKGAQPASLLPAAVGYMAAAERRDRSFYFAALTANGENDNFFGDIVSTTSLDEHVQLTGVDQNDASTAQLDLALQGITDPADHDIAVSLNGVGVGEIKFSGMGHGALVVDVPVGLLKEGDNIITLQPLGGDNDVTVVDHVILSYLRQFKAVGDQLRFTMPGQSSAKLTGFATSAVHVVCLDSPVASMDITVSQESDGTYSAVLNNSDASGGVFYAYTEASIAQPASISAHSPSHLADPSTAADFLVVSHADFLPAVAPLASAREQQGLKTKVVDIDNVYDEFNYGEHDPAALKQFLQVASSTWATHPRWLLMVGDASVDPRNFLGQGSFDFVPTKVVPTAQLKTSSDGWFTDFNSTGQEQIATGRLPVRTLSEATAVVNKILAYESQSAGTWSSTALLVADQNIGADFQTESSTIAGVLPPQITISSLNVADPVADHTTLVDEVNAGKLLVNYLGHGSVDVWSTGGLFTASDAQSLTNGSMAPFFINMDCLNGFFHDVYQTSMAEQLLLNSQGGAIAVWASSGLTEPGPQFGMDEALMQYLFTTPAQTIGEATKNAKQGITDPDVRRTWMLFGDPSMKLKFSVGN